ncbi:MAG: SAM-dependent methyltransferase [Bacteroidetes bacterium]|nr:SAM-dependent methyltransferase [Bacteroidota bacterium]
MIKGVLYLIPVPISENEFSEYVYPSLEKTVNALDEFIVEDLKTARHSLRKIGYKRDFDKTTFHLLNEHANLKARLPDGQGIEKFLSSAEKGKNIGLMSEAGMPAIADPGSEIVKLAHKKNIKVVPLYGQSSIFLALASSGLNGQNFCFHGYLPKSQNERKRKLKELERNISHNNQTQIFIETPYRNNHLLEDILSICSSEILLCIASDISGKDEMIITKSISEWRKEKFPDINKRPTVFLLGK